MRDGIARHSPGLELLHPDAAHGLAVRAFIAQVADDLGLSRERIADLQLAATELLASAVEWGSGRFTISLSGSADAWTLEASGIGDLDAAPAELAFTRMDLLTGLLAEVEADRGVARLRGGLAEPA